MRYRRSVGGCALTEFACPHVEHEDVPLDTVPIRSVDSAHDDRILFLPHLPANGVGGDDKATRMVDIERASSRLHSGLRRCSVSSDSTESKNCAVRPRSCEQGFEDGLVKTWPCLTGLFAEAAVQDAAAIGSAERPPRTSSHRRETVRRAVALQRHGHCPDSDRPGDSEPRREARALTRRALLRSDARRPRHHAYFAKHGRQPR